MDIINPVILPPNRLTIKEAFFRDQLKRGQVGMCLTDGGIIVASNLGHDMIYAKLLAEPTQTTYKYLQIEMKTQATYFVVMPQKECPNHAKVHRRFLNAKGDAYDILDVRGGHLKLWIRTEEAARARMTMYGHSVFFDSMAEHDRFALRMVEIWREAGQTFNTALLEAAGVSEDRNRQMDISFSWGFGEDPRKIDRTINVPVREQKA